MQLLNITTLFLYLLYQTEYKPNPVPKLKHTFIVIAHRGDHTIYPENTLEAYKQAIKNGADYIEIDLRTTRDGQFISLHDASVNRMTDGKGLVKDLTLEQIENLKISSKNKADSTHYRIPKFDDILKLCRHKIHIYIDFKEADAVATFTMLKKFHMENDVLVYINKPAQFTDWRKTMPTMPLMLSLPNNVKDTVAMKKFIDDYHPDVLDGDYSDYNNEMVEFATKLGFPVWPDGQSAKEGPAVWDKAISLNLKGLQTDNPPALVNYLKQKGLR
jgi:glycerophosphoryl diester phosphodiesterase